MINDYFFQELDKRAFALGELPSMLGSVIDKIHGAGLLGESGKAAINKVKSEGISGISDVIKNGYKGATSLGNGNIAHTWGLGGESGHGLHLIRTPQGTSRIHFGTMDEIHAANPAPKKPSILGRVGKVAATGAGLAALTVGGGVTSAAAGGGGYAMP